MSYRVRPSEVRVDPIGVCIIEIMPRNVLVEPLYRWVLIFIRQPPVVVPGRQLIQVRKQFLVVLLLPLSLVFLVIPIIPRGGLLLWALTWGFPIETILGSALVELLDMVQIVRVVIFGDGGRP